MDLAMAHDIQTATRSDTERLVGLWLAFMREQGRLAAAFRPGSDAEMRIRNDLPEWLRDERRCVLVTVCEGAPVGFAAAQGWTPPPVYAASDEVYLEALYVCPEARGDGRGRALAEAVRAWAVEQGATRLRLGVAAANEPARSFWEHFGAAALALTYAIDVEASEKTDVPRKPKRRIGF